MLLLVTGASGVGKTTVRMTLTPRLGPRFDCVELWHLGPIPDVPTIAWRQRTVETAVERAADLAPGRHLLLAGDPVAAGEALAAPSADRVDIAVCLLDADAGTHAARLGPSVPAHLVERHVAFATWMRAHAADPSHVPEAVTTDAWESMRFGRWVGRAPGPEWASTIVDTSRRTPAEVTDRVERWVHDAIAGDAPVFRAGWYRD